MSKAALRGTKRWCQDEACGLPFYDLNRTNISCPNCGVVYKVVAPVAPQLGDQRYPRRGPRPPLQTIERAEIEPKAESEEVADADDEIELEKDDSIEPLLEADDDDPVEMPIHPNSPEAIKE